MKSTRISPDDVFIGAKWIMLLFNTFNGGVIHIDQHQCTCINYIIYSVIVFGASLSGFWLGGYLYNMLKMFLSVGSQQRLMTFNGAFQSLEML